MKGATMAVAVVAVERPTVFGDRRVRILDLTFSGNYPDEGEPLTAAALGFTRVDSVMFDGAIIAADGETALIPKYNYAASTVLMYEGSAAGTAFTEKTAAEAYPAGATGRAIVIGLF